MPRKGSVPSFSISIVKLTEGWAWFRVFRKSVAVVMLGILVRVSSSAPKPCKQTELINNYARSRVPFVLFMALFFGGV